MKAAVQIAATSDVRVATANIFETDRFKGSTADHRPGVWKCLLDCLPLRENCVSLCPFLCRSYFFSKLNCKLASAGYIF